MKITKHSIEIKARKKLREVSSRFEGFGSKIFIQPGLHKHDGILGIMRGGSDWLVPVHSDMLEGSVGSIVFGPKGGFIAAPSALQVATEIIRLRGFHNLGQYSDDELRIISFKNGRQADQAIVRFGKDHLLKRMPFLISTALELLVPAIAVPLLQEIGLKFSSRRRERRSVGKFLIDTRK